MTIPRLQGDATAAGPVVAPLVGEPPLVGLQKGLGVDPVANECPAAEVVDEDIEGHGQLEAGPTRPLGQIVVVEESQPELLVESADRFKDGAASSASRTPRAW